MTRINCVPVKCLSDKHLMAEYRELPRVFTAVRKHIDNDTLKFVAIPKEYCLGKGHVTFFYDKIGFLLLRYSKLKAELQGRGFKLDLRLYEKVYESGQLAYLDQRFKKKWSPTPQDMYLNMARLTKRSNYDNVLEELSNES